MFLEGIARLGLCVGDVDLTRVYVVVDRNQRPPAAGAGDAFASFDDKQCAMVGALDHASAAIEELVCNPFQRNTQMRAAILVDINFALLFNCKQFAAVELKAFAAAFEYFISGTKVDLIRQVDTHRMCIIYFGAAKRIVRVSNLPSRATLTITLSPGL